MHLYIYTRPCYSTPNQPNPLSNPTHTQLNRISAPGLPLTDPFNGRPAPVLSPIPNRPSFPERARASAERDLRRPAASRGAAVRARISEGPSAASIEGAAA